MISVNCYNGSCGDDGRCGIADHNLRLCPDAVDHVVSCGIPRAVVMGTAKFNPWMPRETTPEERADHFAWERGVGAEPYAVTETETPRHRDDRKSAGLAGDTEVARQAHTNT